MVLAVSIANQIVVFTSQILRDMAITLTPNSHTHPKPKIFFSDLSKQPISPLGCFLLTNLLNGLYLKFNLHISTFKTILEILQKSTLKHTHTKPKHFFFFLRFKQTTEFKTCCIWNLISISEVKVAWWKKRLCIIHIVKYIWIFFSYHFLRTVLLSFWVTGSQLSQYFVVRNSVFFFT